MHRADYIGGDTSLAARELLRRGTAGQHGGAQQQWANSTHGGRMGGADGGAGAGSARLGGGAVSRVRGGAKQDAEAAPEWLQVCARGAAEPPATALYTCEPRGRGTHNSARMSYTRSLV